MSHSKKEIDSTHWWSFQISMGLKVLSLIPTHVANLMDVCFKRCMLSEVGFASWTICGN
jgi:hypothetical protein